MGRAIQFIELNLYMLYLFVYSYTYFYILSIYFIYINIFLQLHCMQARYQDIISVLFLRISSHTLTCVFMTRFLLCPILSRMILKKSTKKHKIIIISKSVLFYCNTDRQNSSSSLVCSIEFLTYLVNNIP